jgi:hypothetical protein
MPALFWPDAVMRPALVTLPAVPPMYIAVRPLMVPPNWLVTLPPFARETPLEPAEEMVPAFRIVHASSDVPYSPASSTPDEVIVSGLSADAESVTAVAVVPEIVLVIGHTPRRGACYPPVWRAALPPPRSFRNDRIGTAL